MTESLLLLPSFQLALWQQPHAYGHTNCLSSKTSCSSWYRGRRPQSARVFRRRCMSTLHNVIHVYTLSSMFWPSSTCCWRSWRGLVGSCLQIWRWVLTYWQVEFAVGKLTSHRVGCCCHLLPASVCVFVVCPFSGLGRSYERRYVTISIFLYQLYWIGRLLQLSPLIRKPIIAVFCYVFRCGMAYLTTSQTVLDLLTTIIIFAAK